LVHRHELIPDDKYPLTIYDFTDCLDTFTTKHNLRHIIKVV